MKMLMVICPENRQEEIRDLISRHDVHAYTELKEVFGEGGTGKKLGNRVWPGKSIIVFSVVDDKKKDELLGALRECKKSLFPAEGFRAFVLPVELMI